MGFFDKFKFSKLKEGLTKTKDDLLGKVNRLIKATGKIDDNFLAQLEEIFITSDIGYETAEILIKNIKD